MTFAALPGHSALAVQDLIQSEVFYRQLGFELLWHDSDWAFLLSPQGWGLALLAPSYRGAGPHLGFHVESRADLERMRLDCCAAGARSVGMIHAHTAMAVPPFMPATPTAMFSSGFRNQMGACCLS